MLADRLRELRKTRHMTATTLAAAAGVSKSFISQLESGRTGASLATLERIATALQVPTGSLLTAPVNLPNGNGRKQQARLLHTRNILPSAPGTRLLSDSPTSAHAAVTVAPGAAASGSTEPPGALLITGLLGTVTLRTRGSALAITAGEVAEVMPSGQYALVNEGHAAATVLVSAAAAEDLPRATARSAMPGETLYDAGPFRLVTMRARRAAERTRSP